MEACAPGAGFCRFNSLSRLPPSTCIPRNMKKHTERHHMVTADQVADDFIQGGGKHSGLQSAAKMIMRPHDEQHIRSRVHKSILSRYVQLRLVGFYQQGKASSLVLVLSKLPAPAAVTAKSLLLFCTRARKSKYSLFIQEAMSLVLADHAKMPMKGSM